MQNFFAAVRRFFFTVSEKIRLFMEGRYGFDAFSAVLAVTAVLMRFIASFFRRSRTAPYYVFTVLMLLAVAYLIFRTLSRNIYARREEYRRFLTVKDKTVEFFHLEKQRFRDRKTHVYRRCPSCRAVMRFPRFRGKHEAKCQKCGTRFSVRVWFGPK